jgi:hypothetical protein
MEASHRSEVSPTVSAEEMWDENFTVDHVLLRVLAAHITPWYRVRMAEESNN